MPIDANDGDVIYGWLRRSYYYNTNSISFQTWQDGQWTNFFSYNEQGDALVKFTFDGTVWSGGIHNWTTLNPIGE